MTPQLERELLKLELQAELQAAHKLGFIFDLSHSDMAELSDELLREWRDTVRGFLRQVRRARG